MTTYLEMLQADRRLVLLRGLLAAAQYRCNAILLRRYAAAAGHMLSAASLATELAWLAEQGLLTLEVSEGVQIATLTARGADVAAGCATVPGVQRPEPGF